MATLQIYDKLLQFPLFQGMSRDDLEIVAGHTRFGFLRLPAGRQIVVEGEPCVQLYFLIKGSIRLQTWDSSHSYRVVEQVSAPYILQQEAIFGYFQRYTHTFHADGDVQFLTLEKEEIVRLSEDFLVFRLNLLNTFATQSQKLQQQNWNRSPQGLRERVIRFFVNHSVYPAGAKTFYILMERLAEEMNDSRLNVSRVLNQLQEENLLTLHRGRVEIPHLEQLLM